MAKRGDNLAKARPLIDDLIEQGKTEGLYGLLWSVQVNGQYGSPWPGTNTLIVHGRDGALLYERPEDYLIVVEPVTIGEVTLQPPRLYERVKERLATAGLLAPDPP